ncbi:hypothetical protein [Mesorhizobium sp. LjNodule214]|uniref:hypothetical protein n=1 Tax=Mesorhizobium sp. LjNodule214 TaxID=3342252 RepID=UPI003ECDD039
MFEANTMMVVGAGASKEASLPTGAELKEKIIELLDMKFSDTGQQTSGDTVIFQTFRKIAREDGEESAVNYFISAARNMSDALPVARSIDNFLDSHKGNRRMEMCGKLAIVRAILTAERSSNLYVSGTNIYNKLHLDRLKNTWYLKLGELLFSCQKDELPERLAQISFIVFNYDRCVEQFLYWGIRIYFGLESEEAGQLVERVRIYHPYGTIGRLPWQDDGKGSVEFGAEDSFDLLALSKQIKTFTEGTDPESSEIVALRRDLDEAETVVFLGFGFDTLNMQLIEPKRGVAGEQVVKAYYATAVGLSESDVEIVKGELAHLCTAHATALNIRNDLYCYKLFEEFRLSLEQR